MGSKQQEWLKHTLRVHPKQTDQKAACLNRVWAVTRPPSRAAQSLSKVHPREGVGVPLTLGLTHQHLGWGSHRDPSDLCIMVGSLASALPMAPFLPQCSGVQLSREGRSGMGRAGTRAERGSRAARRQDGISSRCWWISSLALESHAPLNILHAEAFPFHGRQTRG